MTSQPANGANWIATASASSVGRVRSRNEDAYGEFSNVEGARLLVVADGMGGHRGGATASRVAVETIGEVYSKFAESDLSGACSRANERIFEMAEDDASLRGMGTTVVCLLLQPSGRGMVAHVGDSRAYRIRNGQIAPLTEDHSVVAEMVRRGFLSADEAAVHPRRNEILRSVGVEHEVAAEVTELVAEAGDRYLLCSDGLSGLVEDDEIAAIAGSQAPEDAAQALIDLANERGGTDNITVQIAAVRFVSADAAHATVQEPAAVGTREAEDRDDEAALTPLWFWWTLGAVGAAMALWNLL